MVVLSTRDNLCKGHTEKAECDMGGRQGKGEKSEGSRKERMSKKTGAEG